MNAVGIIFAIISALGGLSGVGSFLMFRSNQKKLHSESKKLLSESNKIDIEGDVLMSDKAIVMYEKMAIRVDVAEKKADAAEEKASQCQASMYELIDHIYLLRRTMSEHKIEPPPFRFPASITGISNLGVT